MGGLKHKLQLDRWSLIWILLTYFETKVHPWKEMMVEDDPNSPAAIIEEIEMVELGIQKEDTNADAVEIKVLKMKIILEI